MADYFMDEVEITYFHRNWQCGRKFSGDYSDFRAYEDSTMWLKRKKQNRKESWKQINQD
jgi:hypothetical protein